MKDNKNRPYAFVQFESAEEANTALKNVHGSLLNGRSLRCERARVNRTLFISPKVNVSEKDTKAILEGFGQIEDLTEACSTNLPNVQEFQPNEWFVKFSFRKDAIKAYNVCFFDYQYY